MESGKNKVTTKEQLSKLVELMEKYPETGRGKPQFGSSKNRIKELWEEVAVELNCLGPPSRTAQEWGRVWIHYKANLKRKLANNRKNLLATGGGPSQEIPLSPLEESVANLVQTRKQVAPGGHALGLTRMPMEMEESDLDLSMTELTKEASLGDHTTPSSSRATKPTRSANNVENERLNLLKTQVETQKEVLKKLGQVEKSLHRNYEINKNNTANKRKKI